MGARALLIKYIRVVKQSNSVSFENPNNLVGSGLQEETRMRVWLAALPLLKPNSRSLV